MVSSVRRGEQVILVGHFPPPIHGMSVATERFAEILHRVAPVRRLDISGDRHGRSASHHLVRIRRTLGAAARVARTGRRGDPIYVTCDAGPGMIYVIVVTAVARLRGMRRFLHHHSFVYISRRSYLMGALVLVTGPETTHVLTCDHQAERFGQLYPRARIRRTVDITYTLDEPAPVPARRPDRGRPFVLGHMSNLTMAKGVGTVIATFEACLARGIDVALHFAGPLLDDEATEAISAAKSRHGDRVVHDGPVHGDAKADFLGGLDVFLFPSRYRNESFGIVVAEAMAVGVPTIALEAGCLTTGWVGDGGLVLQPDGDFVTAAAERIARWVDDPSTYEAASAGASERARAGWAAGTRDAAELADDIVAVPAS
jgi:glycosyltransferase involved in cell wall biosynthesis